MLALRVHGLGRNGLGDKQHSGVRPAFIVELASGGHRMVSVLYLNITFSLSLFFFLIFRDAEKFSNCFT